MDKSGLSIPFVLMMAKYVHNEAPASFMRREPADKAFKGSYRADRGPRDVCPMETGAMFWD